MAETKTENKYTLLTNLSFVESEQAPGLRLWCSAVLIEEVFPEEMNRCQMRGFGVDPRWEVFTRPLAPEYFPYKVGGVQDKETGAIVGSLLRFANGQKFFLQVEDMGQPLDVYRTNDITNVWQAFPRKVAYYWTAPNIPTLNPVPSAMLKQRL